MGAVKTSVMLPEGAIKALREIASRQGTTMGEVLRRAIATEKLLQDTVQEGGKILIEDKEKNLKQIIIR